MGERRLVIVNQAANYLTVGFANAFVARGVGVTLLAGSVHEQGERLDERVKHARLVRWQQRPPWRKALAYGGSLLQAWVLLITRYRRYEVLFISIPPMAYLLTLVLPNRCSALIWDVYPDIFEVTGMSRRHGLYRLWARLNQRAFRRAYRLFTITEPMRDLLGAYIEKDRVTVMPIWSVFSGDERIPDMQNKLLAESPDRQGRFIIQYSGNLGITHNVEALLDLADALRDDDQFLIQIIGRGPREPVIRAAVERRGLGNVEMLPFQSDERFVHSLSAADVGVVALNPRVSRGSVPSKAYNLMAFGIPGLYIAAADSELARYAHDHRTGECFAPGDPDGMASYVRRLADDPDFYRYYHAGALRGARGFHRGNADALASTYLESD
ncbi:glycosyltransferase family 4 protein [Spiribacter sp. 221]|uniref:glycosyltransferase family 4 protein n=1 Tax=Spiribacter onubensis TaxID=3122420 RepID=UPI00349F4DF0